MPMYILFQVYKEGGTRIARKHGKNPDFFFHGSNTDLVLITGASGGIGKVLTALLIEAGWRNIVCQYSTRPDWNWQQECVVSP